jgi:hypothetical protein
VVQPGIVIDVHVGENHGPHLARIEAEGAQARADLLLGLDGELHAEAKVGMPARQLEQVRGRARVDHDRSLGVIDQPGERREPFGPGRLEQGTRDAEQAAARRRNLRGLHPDGPGLQREHLDAPRV